jgi:hypothetical protein
MRQFFVPADIQVDHPSTTPAEDDLTCFVGFLGSKRIRGGSRRISGMQHNKTSGEIND